jgi:putative hemolysin
MKKMTVALYPFIALIFCVAIAVFLSAIQPVQAANPDQPATMNAAINNENASAETAPTGSAAYCLSKGGEVDIRQPYFNTNASEQDWLQLAGAREFCRFISEKDGSRIYVLLSTLYTQKPSLAALAYYAKVQPGSCNGNPASCYCSLLGGSDSFGGINLNGGGWVKKSDPVFTVLESCIFPDMSSIDSFGLFYHSAGIIRGTNLSKVLRYKDPYAKK